MADIAHLIVARGARLDWTRVLERVGENWPLLLAQLHIFSYVYPESKGNVPGWVIEDLLERARDDIERPRSHDRVTRGTFVSQFSFAIDVNEWGFRDLRAERVHEMERSAMVREIVDSDVWDQRPAAGEEYGSPTD